MTSQREDLRAGEHELVDEEVLWRVAGTFAVDSKGQPVVALFRLTSEDRGCLSVARDSRTTPALAVQHRGRLTGKEQVGAWAVTVRDVQGIGLRSIDDSETVPAPDAPGHAYIDKRHLVDDKRAVTAARLRLLTLAIRHAEEGLVYRV